MFLARKHTPAALAEIGTFFGRRSHSTVISAQRTVDGWIAAGERVTLADTDWGILVAIRRVEVALRAG
jgi:chromosomal replication initiator protein